MRILFNSKDKKYKNPFGALREGQECFLNILVPESCPAKRVFVIFESEQTELKFELFRGESQDNYVSFCGYVVIEKSGLYFYHFYIEKEDDGFRLFKQGYDDTNMEAGERWQLTCYAKNYFPPKWAEGAIYYQIFPDRFAISGQPDITEKLKPFRIHENLFKTPDLSPDKEGNWNNDFFGGNLKGITDKLCYVKELGVSAIYLNPIVKAFSNHRYDTCDYLSVDPMLGSAEDFRQLCDEAHKKDIRIIIDGVYNHTGNKSIYFESAITDEKSPYRDWYDFIKYPSDYRSWWGIKTLPQIKKDQPDFIKFITEKVIPFWFNLGADGIRLDVADELTDEFVEKISKSAKTVKSDAVIIGEVWEDASDKISYGVRRKYLLGNELDSVMNYPFMNSVIGFTKSEKSPEEFANEIMTIVENYPAEILNSCMNLLSSHDTLRIFTQLERNVKLLKIAVFLQFMLPGAPSIYYGDEIGMEGGRDPLNRMFFRWDMTGNDIHTFYKKIVKLKKTFKEIKNGSISFEKSDKFLIFFREDMKIIVNLSDEIYKIDGKVYFAENLDDKKLLKYGFALIKEDHSI